MTVKPIVIVTLGTISKGLVKGLRDLEIRGQVETIKTTTLLRLARILRKVLETCCQSNYKRKPTANAGVKKTSKENDNNT